SGRSGPPPRAAARLRKNISSENSSFGLDAMKRRSGCRLRLLPRNGLNLAHQPAVSSRGHEHNELGADRRFINDFAAIQDLNVELRPVAKLHGVAGGSVEDGIQLVPAVLIARLQARLDLRFHPLGEVLLREPGEVRVKQAGAVLFQRSFHALPGKGIIAMYAFAGQIFHGAGAGAFSLQLYMRKLSRRGCGQMNNRQGAYQDAKRHRQEQISQTSAHWPPATSSSFPVTTPEATLMRAPPSTGISTLATPRLIGTSTVVFPPASLLVKLTTVPSGTGLPEQSRTGSVSTRNAFFTRLALIRRLHASAATCCTTRTSLAWPMAAPMRTGPSFRAELIRTQ